MATSPPPNPLTPPSGADAASTSNSLVLQDIKPPVHIFSPWPYAIAALLLALCATLLLAWLLHRRRRRPHTTPTLVVVPPHRRASDALHAALTYIHDPKTFMTLVADALRTYLEERFQLHAPERTTEEFLQELPACPALNSRQTGLLADFLHHSDLVKFARHEPAEPVLRGLWQTAHQLVVETSPPLAEPVDGGVDRNSKSQTSHAAENQEPAPQTTTAPPGIERPHPPPTHPPGTPDR